MDNRNDNGHVTEKSLSYFCTIRVCTILDFMCSNSGFDGSKITRYLSALQIRINYSTMQSLCTVSQIFGLTPGQVSYEIASLVWKTPGKCTKFCQWIPNIVWRFFSNFTNLLSITKCINWHTCFCRCKFLLGKHFLAWWIFIDQLNMSVPIVLNADL